MEKILLFYGSPRKDGNSDLLAKAFIKGAKEKGAEVEDMRLFSLNITPCIECEKCNETGVCILDDDMKDIYEKIEEASTIVVASPIFFYNITSKTQALVERSQAFWIRRYVLNHKLIGNKEKKGIFLSVGATKGKLLFDGALRVIRYYFDAIGGKLFAALLIRGVEKKGDIKTHEYALESSKILGQRVALGDDLKDIKGIWLPK